MPLSVRFFGRRVYAAPVFLLISAMTGGRASLAALSVEFGVDERTIKRWRKWWREDYLSSPSWRTLRPLVGPGISQQDLPGSLIERLRGGSFRSQLLRALMLLTRTLGYGHTSYAEDATAMVF